jgi:hypothetical protein
VTKGEEQPIGVAVRLARSSPVADEVVCDDNVIGDVTAALAHATGALPALPWLAGLEQTANETVSGPAGLAVAARDHRTVMVAARASARDVKAAGLDGLRLAATVYGSRTTAHGLR